MILTNADSGWNVAKAVVRRTLEVIYDGKPEAEENLLIDPGVRGFEFNAPAAGGAYMRLILRDPQHTYAYESLGGGGAGPQAAR